MVRGSNVDLPAPGGAVMTSEWCVRSALFTSSAISEAGSEAHFLVISCVENVILTFDLVCYEKNVLSAKKRMIIRLQN